MENERASISTHAIMEKVREMDLYPVVLAEGRFTASKRLARAMEIAYKALCAPQGGLAGPGGRRPLQDIAAIAVTSTPPAGS